MRCLSGELNLIENDCVLLSRFMQQPAIRIEKRRKFTQELWRGGVSHRSKLFARRESVEMRIELVFMICSNVNSDISALIFRLSFRFFFSTLTHYTCGNLEKKGWIVNRQKFVTKV